MNKVGLVLSFISIFNEEEFRAGSNSWLGWWCSKIKRSCCWRSRQFITNYEMKIPLFNPHPLKDRISGRIYWFFFGPDQNHPSLLCNNSSPGWFKCSIFPEKSRKDGVIWWTLRPDSVDDSGKNLRVRAKPLLRSKPLLSRTSWNKSCQGSKPIIKDSNFRVG